MINGHFEPGQRLRAVVLGSEFGCSASSMREVLFRLASVGLVDFQEQRGFRVTQCSDTRQHELTHLRIMLECEGACLSIRLGGLEWESRLSAAHHKLRHIENHVGQGNANVDDLTLWTRAEEDFHRTLIDSCGSELLVDLHTVIYHQFRQQLITSDREFVFLPENIDQHRRILDAALSHDEAATRESIEDHLSRNLTRPVPAPRNCASTRPDSTPQETD